MLCMWRGAGADKPRKRNDRGQSVVIGAILIFGFLVAALGTYQATVVPNQNEQVEFNHQEQIKDDFSELYAGTLNTAAQNEKHTSSLRLGARYPPRALTLNPPDAAGTLRTDTFSDDISISGAAPGVITDEASTPATTFTMTDFCGSGMGTVPDTKALVYEPEYNVLSGVGVLGYENSARYQDVNDEVPDSNQDLVDGGEITLIPITEGSISKTSASSETVTMKSGATGGTTVDPAGGDPDGDGNLEWTLTLPTRLSPGQWETILEDEGRVESVSGGGGSVDIRLKAEDGSGNDLKYTITCTPIGVNTRPENDPDVVPSTDDDGGDSGLNPVGSEALELESASDISQGYRANFHNNAGEDKEVVAVRAVYLAQPGNCGNPATPCQVKFNAVPSTPTDGTKTVEVGGGFETVSSSEWTWTPDEEKLVDITSSGLSAGTNSGIAIEFKVRDGSGTRINTYFVSASS